ncbi:carbamoyltransferase C-terminal domain-containing protein [Streptomyces sp. NPDC026589]|uniref:carbamoyltransferase family protein n=1 Tax=Streptomyces sp. NPDC026589 TaxID=3155609 RepID=UPI0033DD964E
MRVLGLGGSHHDFCACLVDEGRVVAAVEEERLTRAKVAFGLGPRLARCLAADSVLEQGGIGIDDVDLVVANDFLNKVYSVRFQDRVTWIGHHLSHAASTYYPSPFERAAVLVMDGRGSETTVGGRAAGETVTHYLAQDTDLRVVRAQVGLVTRTASPLDDPYEDSVGWFYEIITKCIGFIGRHRLSEPGKTMGLAPYGTPRYVQDMAQTYTLHDGEFRQSTAQQQALRAFAEEQLARAAGSEQAVAETAADLAYATQANTERIVVELAHWLHTRTGATALCLAGGVALNSVANYLILERTPFEKLFIVPAAGDQGTALGAALYGYHALAGRPREVSAEPFSPYLGRAYDEADVRRALDAQGDRIVVERPTDIHRATAAELAGGSVVGWFQGRAEIGPRALGNRSILADPRQADMKDRINHKVKHREPFRPFAPVVLEDRQAEFFSTAVPAYYMLLVPQVRSDKRDVIPAVTHVDGTARLQTASAVLNPHLTLLLEEFDKLTGVPVLLNTSFNDNHEPIVETPEDAVRCFLGTGIDVLAIHGFLVRKAP